MSGPARVVVATVKITLVEVWLALWIISSSSTELLPLWPPSALAAETGRLYWMVES